MRTGLAACLFAAALLVPGAAFAKPNSNDSDTRTRPGTPAAPTAAPRNDGHPQMPVRGGSPAVTPQSGKDGHGGKGDHHGGHGWGFYPYPPVPLTWPYQAYPYSQYYYPYPPQYYPNGVYDDDNSAMPSTRGLVVPGDLPMGVTAFWYYCDTPDGYYPYVKECSHDWTRIPVSPPPPGTAAPLSYSDWQWCEEKKAFFPYVTSCAAGFTPMPVTVPGKDQAGPPQTANWYFCADPKGYSPYVVQCARDWRAVPAVPPPSVKITVKDEKAK
jgi:hypothetical protein